MGVVGKILSIVLTVSSLNLSYGNHFYILLLSKKLEDCFVFILRYFNS